MIIKIYEVKTDNVYTYINLFAGAGVFEDNSKGFPMLLVYDKLSEHYESGYM